MGGIEMVALAVAGLVLVLGLVFSILSYILFAIGLGTIAKREGKENSWLSWIPIAQWYLMADIVKGKKFVRSGALFIVYTLTLLCAGMALMVIAELAIKQDTTLILVCTIIGYILVMLASTYVYLVHYYVLARYTRHALLLTLLGFFVSELVTSIGVYVIRNNAIIGEVKEPITDVGIVDEQSPTDQEV